jgi:DNA-directed RNA polymerase specialized sigma subunit
MYDDLYEYNQMIERKLDRVSELRAALTSMSAPLGEKSSGSHEDRMANLMCKIVILENELEGLIDDYADRKRKVQQEIFMLENEDWQDIMYMSFVEFKNMHEIAEIKGTTYDCIKKKRQRAMKNLKTLIKNQTI